MKKVLSLGLAVMMTLGLAAQSVNESVAAIGDLSVPACNVSLKKDVKVVKGAMDQYLKENGLKVKGQQGYQAAINQVIPTISQAEISLYTKVEKQKKNALVTVAVIGNDLTIDQADLRDKAKSWLDGFVQYIARYEASQSMNAEQKNLDKANKAAAKASKNLAAIEKAIANDQKKIEAKKADNAKLKEKIQKNEQDIKDLQSDIEKQTKKKADAQDKVKAANENVNEVQGEVDRYRQMAQ